jgi:hypothetical protein
MLAYQSFGVVYGDLSVSPLYVFRSTFSGDLHNHVTVEEIYGVLSLIFWTLTMVPVVKYVIIILSADDNGEGNSPASLSLSLWSHESHNIVRWDDELMLPLCEAELDPQPADGGCGAVHVQAGSAAGDAAGRAGAQAPGEAQFSQDQPSGHRAARHLHEHRRRHPHPVHCRSLMPSLLP